LTINPSLVFQFVYRNDMSPLVYAGLQTVASLA
jgi:hypothetical protein